MPITVNHSTPADGTFSATGATAWDANHTLTGVGTMAEQNANAVAITGGTATLTSVTTPIVQATNSAGLALKNSGGTTQISMGAGGGDNVTVAVSTNLNGTNAQIDISPTGTGHVHIKPTGVNSVEIAPTYVGEMDNITIGSITPKAGTFAGLTVQDTTDGTKKGTFDLTGLTTATNYTYALPALSGSTLAVLGLAQTWTAVQTFTGITTSGLATSTNIGTSTTTGLVTIGGTVSTSILTVGRSTVSQTTNIQAGVTASGSTKTMNIGTAGAAGSTTTIAIGSTTGTSTTTVNGILKQQTYTVATLPSASTSGVGSRSFVTDALAPAFGATVVTGGAIAVPVYSDGTNWKVG
jgi:hypothetical protein